MYQIEKVWKDWKIVRLIGEGGFGKVYEIMRSNFGIEERCALKVITIPSSPAEMQSFRSEGMDDKSLTAYYSDVVETFANEIALMVKLNGNENIVAYEDYAVVPHEGKIGWDILLRMELLTPYTDYLRDNIPNEDSVIEVALALCEALKVCHAQKIIHRDIKIDNVFIGKNGTYKLGDFGVARTLSKTESALSKKGTYTYMAPEVYKGEPYNLTADIYSLGMMMYRLLNFNREPFIPLPPSNVLYSDKNEALVKRMRGEPLPPPANAGKQLSSVILRACAYRAEDRFSSAEEMAQALNELKNARAANRNAPYPYAAGESAHDSVTSAAAIGIYPEPPSPQIAANGYFAQEDSVTVDAQMPDRTYDAFARWPGEVSPPQNIPPQQSPQASRQAPYPQWQQPAQPAARQQRPARQQPAQPAARQPRPVRQQPVQPAQGTSVKPIIGLILGIASASMCWIPFLCAFSILPAVPGLVFSVMGKKWLRQNGQNTSKAVIAIILCIAGIAAGVALFFVYHGVLGIGITYRSQIKRY